MDLLPAALSRRKHISLIVLVFLVRNFSQEGLVSCVEFIR
jgi:hypothetical protein